MARDALSAEVLRFLRDAHHGGRPSWPNYDTITAGAQYRLLHRLCREWIPAGGQVLDWGAGTGHASVYLSRAGYATAGYSMEPFSYRDLLGSAPYRFVAADPAEPVRLPFGHAEFDAVLSVGVLEHVRETGGNELGSLSEIRRVLKPDAVLICVHLPNLRSWIEALARRQGVKGHDYRYNRQQVDEMFGAAGFRVERYGRYGMLPRNRVGRILPRGLCDLDGFSRVYDAADRLGALLLPWFVQNHYVVARAPANANVSAGRKPA